LEDGKHFLDLIFGLLFGFLPCLNDGVTSLQFFNHGIDRTERIGANRHRRWSNTALFAGIVTFRRRDADSAAIYNHLVRNNVVCALRAGGIRFSPHFYTPFEQLDRAMELIINYRS
jgi:hypothetical protein